MKAREGIIASQMGDECVLVPVGEAANEIHGIVRLNETGSFIWNAITQGLEEEEIAKRITEEYEVDFDGALNAVRTLVARLKEAKLVE